MRFEKYILLAMLIVSTSALAQNTDQNVDIESVEIRGTRLLKDVGLQRVRLDTVALHDNISLSMGDVLLQSTNTFIKSYGRGTMATVSVRGTAPSHTQVLWNGMSINSPMLGMVDFSLVPAYFVDDASLYMGAGSVGVAPGGLGGAITLENHPVDTYGFGINYIQGLASFSTFDEYMRLTYGAKKWSLSTRLLYSSSRNNFKYTNYAKLPELSFDDYGNIVGRRYTTERNKNGSYSDFHLLQELYYNSPNSGRFGLIVWYMLSNRGVPRLSTDYRDDSLTRALQEESTLRAVLSWNKIVQSVRFDVKVGYTYTDMLYRYMFDLTGSGEETIDGVHSQSYVQSAFGKFDIEYSLRNKLLISADVSANQYFVTSRDDVLYNSDDVDAIVGYRQARFEVSTTASIKYRPTDRLGLATSVRWNLYGRRYTPIVPAVFVDYLVSRKGGVILKGSVTRNYRYPTLNDLYFQPGGNPDLKSERGFTYDGGVEICAKSADKRVSISGEVSGFDSYIKNWILWRPTFKGFWTPSNIRYVHSYGFEIKASVKTNIGRGWVLSTEGLFSMTRSLNNADPVSENDMSYGKQLPYIPVYTSSATCRLSWRGWALAYKWRYYSERYTVSSGDMSAMGVIAPYFMSDISFEKSFSKKWGELSIRADVNNLFNEEYETVLSHPMPGRNFGIFLGISPNFKVKGRKKLD